MYICNFRSTFIAVHVCLFFFVGYSGSKRNMNQFNTTSALLNDLKERERDFEVMPLETIGHFMGIEYVYEIDLDRKTFVAKQVGLHEQLWTGHWPLETELNDLDGDVGWDVGWDYTKDTVLRFDLTKSPKDIMNRWKASIKKYNRKLMGDDEKMFDEIARGKKSTFVSDGGQREEIQNKIEEQVKQRLKKMKEDFDQRGLQEFKETEGSKHTRKRKQESD